tara:strand:- start:53 stop:271 length:219 start_codon:yes stop_codon:yes gene_type:complete
MKTSIPEYVTSLEERVSFFMRNSRHMKTREARRHYLASMALCRVVGDFTGEEIWDVYDRIHHAMYEAEAAAA